MAATGAQRRQDFTRGEEARRVQKGKETGFFSTPLRSYTCPVHPGLINKSLSSSSSSSRLPLGPAFFESNIVFVPLSKRGIESLPLYLSYVLCEPLYTVQLYSPRRCYLRNSPAKDFLRAPKVSSTSLEGDTYLVGCSGCTSVACNGFIVREEKKRFFFSLGTIVEI